MSKSVGNTIDLEDLLAKYGADVCRWWVSSLPYENDVKMDIAFFDRAGDTYRKVRNTLRFLLSNLADFAAPSAPPEVEPTSLNAWVLERAASMQAQVTSAFESYAFRRAHQALYDFCNETLSALYCAAVKDRLYCDRPDSDRRRAAQAVMWDVAHTLCHLLAPFLPHTADEAYRALMAPDPDEPAPDQMSVHLRTFPAQPVVDADPGWANVMSVRDAVRKALEEAKTRGVENPLDAEVVLADPEGTHARFAADLADLFGVSRVRLVAGGDAVTVNDLGSEPKCDRCWRRVESCATRAGSAMLCDRCADAVSG